MERSQTAPKERLHWWAAASVIIPMVAAAALGPILFEHRHPKRNDPTAAFPGLENLGSEAYQLGQAHARRDLAIGDLAVEIYGLQFFDGERYDLLLRQQFGIRRRTVADCLVDQKTIDHAKGYNEIMGAEIIRRYGTNFWERAWAEAYPNRIQKKMD